jgi:hypothetical protein
MQRIIAAVVTLLLATILTAEARPMRSANVIHCDDRGCSDTRQRAPEVGRVAYRRAPQSAGLAAPSRYIGGRLVCAVNVNAALAERGIRGTGSALAKSFLHWGQPSAPVPGAVAVYNRGGKGKGHVAIVSRVEGGTVYVLNPGRGGWREVAYPKRAIAYRVAA